MQYWKQGSLWVKRKPALHCSVIGFFSWPTLWKGLATVHPVSRHWLIISLRDVLTKKNCSSFLFCPNEGGRSRAQFLARLHKLHFRSIWGWRERGRPGPKFFGTFSSSVFLVYFFTNANVLNSQLFLSSIFMSSSPNPKEQQCLLKRTSLIKQVFCL